MPTATSHLTNATTPTSRYTPGNGSAYAQTPYVNGRNYPVAPHPTPATETRDRMLPKELRPPVLNPYDAFSADEFDQWIGGITSALRRALGREDEIEVEPEPREESGVLPEEEAATDGESQEEEEGVLEDSFAEWKERKAARTAGRGPEEADALDASGAKEQPIEILSDDEDDDAEDDEEDEEDGDEEGYEEDEDYAEEEGAVDGVAHARVDASDEDVGVYEDDEYDDQDEEDEEAPKVNGAGAEDVDGFVSEEDAVSTRAHEDEFDEDELEEDDEEEEEYDDEEYERQEHYDEEPLGDSDEENAVTGERGDDVISIVDVDEDDEGHPEEDQDAPAAPTSASVAQPIELPDPWTGPRMYAEDFYSSGDLRDNDIAGATPSHLTPRREDDGLEYLDVGEDEAIPEISVVEPDLADDLFDEPPVVDVEKAILTPGVLSDLEPATPQSVSDAELAPTLSDAELALNPDTTATLFPEILSASADSSPPPPLSQGIDELEPAAAHSHYQDPPSPGMQLADPWVDVDTFAEDFYAAGDFRPPPGGDASMLEAAKHGVFVPAPSPPPAVRVVAEANDVAMQEAVEIRREMERGEAASEDRGVRATTPAREDRHERATTPMREDIGNRASTPAREPPPHLLPTSTSFAAAPRSPTPTPTRMSISPRASSSGALLRAHERSASPLQVAPNGHVNWTNPPAFPRGRSPRVEPKRLPLLAEETRESPDTTANEVQQVIQRSEEAEKAAAEEQSEPASELTSAPISTSEQAIEETVQNLDSKEKAEHAPTGQEPEQQAQTPHAAEEVVDADDDAMDVDEPAAADESASPAIPESIETPDVSEPAVFFEAEGAGEDEADIPGLSSPAMSKDSVHSTFGTLPSTPAVEEGPSMSDTAQKDDVARELEDSSATMQAFFDSEAAGSVMEDMVDTALREMQDREEKETFDAVVESAVEELAYEVEEPGEHLDGYVRRGSSVLTVPGGSGPEFVKIDYQVEETGLVSGDEDEEVDELPDELETAQAAEDDYTSRLQSRESSIASSSAEAEANSATPTPEEAEANRATPTPQVPTPITLAEEHGEISADMPAGESVSTAPAAPEEEIPGLFMTQASTALSGPQAHEDKPPQGISSAQSSISSDAQTEDSRSPVVTTTNLEVMAEPATPGPAGELFQDLEATVREVDTARLPDIDIAMPVMTDIGQGYLTPQFEMTSTPFASYTPSASHEDSESPPGLTPVRPALVRQPTPVSLQLSMSALRSLGSTAPSPVVPDVQVEAPVDDAEDNFGGQDMDMSPVSINEQATELNVPEPPVLSLSASSDDTPPGLATLSANPDIVQEDSSVRVCDRCGGNGHESGTCTQSNNEPPSIVGSPAKKCFSCGGTGHTTRDCIQCFECGQTGHLTMKCPQRQKRQIPHSPLKQEATAKAESKVEAPEESTPTVEESQTQATVSAELADTQPELRSPTAEGEAVNADSQEDRSFEEDLVVASLLEGQEAEADELEEATLQYPDSEPGATENIVPADSVTAELGDEVDAEGEIDEEYYSGLGTPWTEISPTQSTAPEEEDPFKLTGSDSTVAPGSMKDDNTPSTEKVEASSIKSSAATEDDKSGDTITKQHDTRSSSTPADPGKADAAGEQLAHKSSNGAAAKPIAEIRTAANPPVDDQAPPRYRKGSRSRYESERKKASKENTTTKARNPPPLKTYSRKDKGKATEPESVAEPAPSKKRPRLEMEAVAPTPVEESARQNRAASETAHSEASGSASTSATSGPSPSFTHDVSWTNASPVTPPPNFIGGILRHQHHAPARTTTLQTYSRKPPITTYTSKAKQAETQAQSGPQPPTQAPPPSSQANPQSAGPLSATQSIPSMSRSSSIQGSPSRPRGVRKTASLDVSSPRTTRSNCRYHKISIPKTEDGPRICFLVPGCSLANHEFMEEEEIEDLGEPEPADQERMVNDIESLDISAYLVHVLRILLGVDMLQEHDIFYVPEPGEMVRRRRERPRENKFVLFNPERPQHLYSSKRKRQKSASISSLSELDELSDGTSGTHGTENSMPAQTGGQQSKGPLRLHAATSRSHPARSTETDSTAADQDASVQSQPSPTSPTESASAAPSRSGGSSVKMTSTASKVRRTKRLSMDAAAYAPRESSPLSEISESSDVRPQPRRTKGQKGGAKKVNESTTGQAEARGSGAKRPRGDDGEDTRTAPKKRKTAGGSKG
ncbi:hypothetical protein PUNSTDRAFT_145240 [Punctularia strigosozonata HHB-11173 SS5]|uniref:uncharacterized protein n=1 Tax=Punctularia strigosozonata (strain HHB-11173) TaxID=741275 RepID=UPI00044182B5|nr:uncharacterized protein PUNSTDRAFT_145240 [Punctularia strigosozonata HHB-11173 SS5]EIN06728.1 hypothetical protein PUNSTDRAFT_145240 [Punctularia strigosozonata HHB-11173 SS5]